MLNNYVLVKGYIYIDLEYVPLIIISLISIT